MSIEEFLHKLPALNNKDYTSLLFNLYEDENKYTMEAVFDNDKLIVGREEPVFICDKNADIDFKAVLKDIKKVLKNFYTENKKELSNLKEISYGFVDGDLYYIRKPRKKKRTINDIEKYTAEDFKDFDLVKLHSWITVYTDSGKQLEMGMPLFSKDMKEEDRDLYIQFLVDNFDYKKMLNM